MSTFRLQRTAVALALFASMLTSLAQPAPLPRVVQGLPGSVQPTAPGYRAGQALPTLTLKAPIPGVRKIEYLSNGFIEVAHVLITLPTGDSRDAAALLTAQRAVAATWLARSTLSEVDVSVYGAGSYAGFGGPPPIMTASVPATRQTEFAGLTVRTLSGYDRAWLARATQPIRIAPAEAYEGPETGPTYVGSARQALAQQRAQRLSGLRGSRTDGSVFYQGDPGIRQIALTFDDGVHPLYEPLILDALKRSGARATFFIVGRNALAYPYFVRDIVAQGHEVANHTYHHVRLPSLTAATIRDELTSTDVLLTGLTGQDIRFFRPPGGRFSGKVLDIARSEGLVTAMWTDDPGDFNNIGQAVVEHSLLNHLRPGGIVLLHENVPDTIRIMGDFVNDARAGRYQLVTLAELARPK